MKTFEVKNLKKYYGKVKALDGVTLSAEGGTIFGLLGPNGAGKTTLVRLLSTLIPQTAGEAKVLGIDVKRQPQKVRETIGLAGQYAAVDEFLTGRENLYMVGRLYRLSHKDAKERSQEILKKLSLEEAADRQVGTYSGGMRRRLDVGASLVGEPKVLFLDEPTTGLDPRTRYELWEIIRGLAKTGTSIVLTTQYLEEADRLADKIAVIDRGKVIATGTSRDLKRKLGGDVVELEVANEASRDKAADALKQSGLDTKILEEGVGLRVPAKGGAKTLLKVVDVLNKARITPTAVGMHQPSLDDVFLALTGETAKKHERGTAKQKRAAGAKT